MHVHMYVYEVARGHAGARFFIPGAALVETSMKHYSGKGQCIMDTQLTKPVACSVVDARIGLALNLSPPLPALT